ncbi:DNA excision repair protein ERCC-8-like [Gigantopelta aegis]|uniref:DNA excision repair protein ERCC-8-like n=1 Tax=Gigantopelta aegis TaxID=1735272 RepID=UPI001B8891EC|nr:DNA excision repair protein ERCC-8-like [Gigantopelta aegis]
MLRLLKLREIGADNPLILYRAETTRRLFGLELSKYTDCERVHKSPIGTLDIDLAEGRYLLSGATNGTVAIHDLEDFSGDFRHIYKHVCGVNRDNRHAHKHSVTTVQWYPLDTGLFTTSGTDKVLKIWDTNRLIPADKYRFDTIIYSHHLSPIATKHTLLAVGCEGSTLKLVDLRAGSSTHMLKGHKSSIFCVKWSTKDEFILASGSADNRVMLWDIRKAKGSLMSLDQHNKQSSSGTKEACTAHNGHVNGMCFTSDGLFLLTFGTDDTLRLWNTSTGKNTMVNYGSIRNDSRKNVQIAISQNGCPDVVIVPNETNIEILELHSGMTINTLRGHYSQVNSCVYHRDRHEVYSGSNDRNILIWVPETATDYDEYLKSETQSKSRNKFVSRIAATADSWSSEED